MKEFIGGRAVELKEFDLEFKDYEEIGELGTVWRVLLPGIYTETVLVQRISDTDLEDGIAEFNDVEELIEELENCYDFDDEEFKQKFNEFINRLKEEAENKRCLFYEYKF
jgi:hypothetical protein